MNGDFSDFSMVNPHLFSPNMCKSPDIVGNVWYQRGVMKPSKLLGPSKREYIAQFLGDSGESSSVHRDFDNPFLGFPLLDGRPYVHNKNTICWPWHIHIQYIHVYIIVYIYIIYTYSYICTDIYIYTHSIFLEIWIPQSTSFFSHALRNWYSRLDRPNMFDDPKPSVLLGMTQADFAHVQMSSPD